MYSTTGAVLIAIAFLPGGSVVTFCTTAAANCAEVLCGINRESGWYWARRAGNNTQNLCTVPGITLTVVRAIGWEWLRLTPLNVLFLCPGGTEPMVVNRYQYCHTPTAGGCASLHFDSLGHSYWEVCGFVRGYQYYIQYIWFCKSRMRHSRLELCWWLLFHLQQRIKKAPLHLRSGLQLQCPDSLSMSFSTECCSSKLCRKWLLLLHSLQLKHRSPTITCH